MSKAVMISIKPEWVEKIINGKKTIEVRKTAPKLETPFKCYIYCTNNKKYNIAPFRFVEGWFVKKYDETTHYANGCTWNKKDDLNGKVVAEFTCDEIIDYIPTDKKGKFTGYFITRLHPRDCLTEEERMKYGAGRWLYGFHISDLKIYDQPKYIKNFNHPCDGDCDCCKYSILKEDRIDCCKMIERPPQSWCYVEEI